MPKRLIYALILIVLVVVVLLMNDGSVSVNLVITKISGAASLIFLGFVAVGVVIGALLK